MICQSCKNDYYLKNEKYETIAMSQKITLTKNEKKMEYMFSFEVLAGL